MRTLTHGPAPLIYRRVPCVRHAMPEIGLAITWAASLLAAWWLGATWRRRVVHDVRHGHMDTLLHAAHAERPRAPTNNVPERDVEALTATTAALRDMTVVRQLIAKQQHAAATAPPAPPPLETPSADATMTMRLMAAAHLQRQRQLQQQRRAS